MRHRRARLLLFAGAACALALWAASRASAFDQYSIFFGNLHSHTSYSDGSGRPAAAFDYARITGRLDFLAITEHNHGAAEQGAPADRRDGILIATDPSLYEDLKSAAEQKNQDGTFVTFYGQEFSTISAGNHMNIFFVEQVIRENQVPNGDFRELYENYLGDQLAQFNHPWNHDRAQSYGLPQYQGDYARLRQASERNVRLIEVINGPGTQRTAPRTRKLEGVSHYHHYLLRGFRLAPTGDQDNHYRTWGRLTDTRTGVLATELSRPAILAALEARRCYATQDKNLRVWFSVNGRVMGSEAGAASRELQIRLRVEDPDEPTAFYSFTLVYGNPGQTDSLREREVAGEKGDQEKTLTLLTPYDHTFVYLRVTQWPNHASRKQEALTAPVWIHVQ